VHHVVISLFLAAQPAPDEVRFVETMVTSALAKDERFDVVNVDALCASEDCLQAIAQAHEAQLIVFGDMRKLGKRVYVALNLYDARARDIPHREAIDARNAVALRKEMKDLARRLLVDEYVPRPKLVMLHLQTTSPPVDDGEHPPYFAWGLTAGGAVGLATGGLLAMTFVEDPREEQNGIGREITASAGVVLAAASAATVALGAYFLMGE
jgi:hypothetical protein